MPVMPQNAAGWRIEPPVSVPGDRGARRAATASRAAAGPSRPVRGSQGFAPGAKAEFSLDEPMANSSQLSLPSVTAPAWPAFCTTVASNGER